MITKEQLQKFVNDNPKVVTMKASTRFPKYFVLKYKRCVFYQNLWTPELELCRGTVVDEDFNIVVRPFTKIYNRGERDTDIPLDEMVNVVEKVNGFMAAVTYSAEHGCIVSTTGSLDSDFVGYATEYVKQYFDYITAHAARGERYTWLFEICHPDDPHIIEEKAGAYLIGAQLVDFRDSILPESVLDYHAVRMKAMRPKWSWKRFSEVVENAKNVQHEGFVVHGKTTRLKIKSPYYLTLKAIARVNFDNIVKGYKQRIDEEFFPLVDYLKTVEGFADMDEQSKLNVIREFLSKGQ